jgi:hypothetical protein
MSEIIIADTATTATSTSISTHARSWLRRSGARAFLAYAFFALIADFPILPGDPASVPSMLGGDIVQTAWFLEWTPWAILHGHSIFSTTLINYPTGANLAQNTGIPLLGLVSAPLTLLVSPIASMNLLRWIAFWLSAYAAFAVIRKWTSFAPAAFVGGLLYGFSPYMISQGSLHLNLYFVPLPPVIVYLLFEILVTQRRPIARSGLWLGLACVAQFYISSEVLATTLLVAGIAGFVLFFACLPQVPSRVAHAVPALLIAGVFTAVLTGYPVWLMFHGTHRYIGPAQGYQNVYNADLLGAIIPTMHQLVAPAHLEQLGTSLVGRNPQENGSYLGIPLVITGLVVVVRYWRKLWTIYLGLMIVAVYALSLGSKLVVDGHLVTIPFGLPFAKLDRLPGIDNILPVRLSLYVAFLVAVLVAIGIDAYRDDFVARHGTSANTGRRLTVTLGRAGGVILAASSLVALLPNWPYASVPVVIHKAQQPTALAIVPKNSVVLTYPYATSFADQAMLWQALDDMRFRMLGSYALLRGPKGGADVAPDTLQPALVQAMFINSVTPTPDPAFPEAVATSQMILANKVQILGLLGPRPKMPPGGGTLGQVAFVDKKDSVLLISTTPRNPVRVAISVKTTYVRGGRVENKLAGVIPGRWVVVSGRSTTGTVTPQLTAQLRQYLSHNRVGSIVIELGLRDSWEIGVWVRAAIGKPTLAGAGGEIWTGVQQRLRQTASK